MRKLLLVHEMRALEKQVNLGEISYSRMIEIINEKAEEYANLTIQITTLKLQEKHKDSAEIVDLLKSYCIKCEEQAKEIERLKGENDNNEEHF